MKRHKTKYVGVFYRTARRLGKKGKEKVYYVVFKKGGKVYEEKVGRQFVDDMSPARAASIRSERIEGKRKSRKEIKAELKARELAAANKYTIQRLWKAYKENRPNLKGIVTDENRFQNYIQPHFGDKEPSEIIPLEVDRLRLRLLKSKAPGTVRNVLELLRRISNFGVKKNLCDGLAFTIEMPQVNSLKTEDLTPDQLSSLLVAIDQDTNPQAGNMMKLALFTGMRRGEMFRLQWSDIDFQNRFILLRDPKGGVDQRIPLNDAAQELLANHIRTDSPFVFPGRGGRKRTDIKHQVNRIKKRAGLPKSFRALHGLRHTYASMLASSGQVDMFTLQKLLTHKSPQMTARYAHLRDDALKRAANLAGDLIREAANKKSDSGAVVNFKEVKKNNNS